MEDAIQEIIDSLANIHEDNDLPKNIKTKIKDSMNILANNDCNIDLRVNESLEELSTLAEDPNIPTYTKMQIWSIVSQLESK
jgi:uncharacterized protein